MKRLADIMDAERLAQLVREGYITRLVRDDGVYALYNYTPRATYERLWTPETRQCRGLIVEADTGVIAAWPFDKFSNLDEPGFPDSSQAALAARPDAPEITEKLDGSMVAIWYDWHRGEWQCSTRGSFVSAQARAARQWLTAHNLPDGWLLAYTYLAEWCAPDNRVVLRYDEASLRLIGARRLSTGQDMGYAVLQPLAAHCRLPVVARVESDLAALIAQQGTASGVEGWVLRWGDGHRVKVKTAEYLRLHRLVSLFSPARVREALLEGVGAAERYIAQLPEELRAEAERIVEALMVAEIERTCAVRDVFSRLQPLLAEGRKAFALAVLREPAALQPLLFALADDRPITATVLKSLDLVALFGEQPQEVTP